MRTDPGAMHGTMSVEEIKCGKGRKAETEYLSWLLDTRKVDRSIMLRLSRASALQINCDDRADYRGL